MTATSLPPANLTVVASPPSVTTPSNGSGLVANFVITNPYATSTEVWAPSCLFTGAVTSCGGFTPTYYQIPAGQTRTMAVTYATGSPGNGTLALAVWHYVPGMPNRQTSGTLSVTVTGTDPVVDAPPIDSTTPSSLGQTAAFLYTGPDAIQTGVTPGSIDPLRTAVMRGRVLDTAGVALSAVQVTVLDHPEWGTTSSRSDGWFDFAYNGGGTVTVTYTKPGLLTAQRPLTLSWEQRGLVDTVVMTPLDPHTATITFAAPIQVARGSVVSDSLGTRQATMMFRQGTTATMRLANGTTQPLTSLTVRATEFTLGSRGPMRMPGPLPPTSMFTYATEVSVDEAMAAGATRVDFSNTFAFYVDNILNLPTGTRLPVGTYDRTAGIWRPEADGRVLRILSTSPVQVAVSYTDSTTPAPQVQLDSLGITAAELTQLGTTYAAGKRLWRAQLNHLTPADINFPAALPNKAWGPLASLIRALVSRNCTQPGSIIACESQTLGEDVGITGTPFTLHYQSDRSRGYLVDRQVVIPPQVKRDSSGITAAAPIKRNQFPSHVFDVSYRLEVAGRTIEYVTPVGSLSTIPGQTLLWDGTDIYNRAINGSAPAKVTLGYTYANAYAVATGGGGGGGGSGFGAPPSAQVITRASRTRIELGQVWEGTLGGWDSRAGLGLGGWSFSPHHVYDPTSRTLWLGSGARVQAEPMGNIGKFIPATIGNSCTSDDCGGLALRRWRPGQSASDAIGRLYVPYEAEGGAYGSGGRVRIFTAQGDSVNAIGGLSGPSSVAVSPDGSIYVAESYSHIVRRIRADSTRVVVAGTSGVSGFAGDGGPATAALLSNPVGIAVGPDGSLFIADQGNHRVRRVAPDGTISTYAGTGATTFVVDGGRATTTPFPYPNTVTQGADGSLYVGMAESVAGALISLLRRVDASGIVSTVAGYASAAGPGPTAARQLAVASFSQVVIGPDGAPLFAAVLPGGPSISAPTGVWRATLNGDLARIAGTGIPRCFVVTQGITCNPGTPREQNGELAGRTFLEGLRGLAVGPDGSMFLSETWQTGGSNTSFIRAIRPAAPGLAATTMLVASADGREVYEFTSAGRHMRTRDALSGRTLLVFDYNPTGWLIAARDSLGNTTTIERNAQGTPTAIVAPFGQRTTVTLDANRNLRDVLDPAGNRVRLTHSALGLLTELRDPRDKVYTFAYDADGRLLSDTDPATGVTTLRRVARDTGYTVVDSTALNRKTTYTVDYLPDGSLARTVTDPSGFVRRSWRTVSASDSTRAPDSTRTLRVEAADPRFGSQAPYLQRLLVRLPSGDTSLVIGRRSTVRSDSTNPFAVTRDSSFVTVNGQTFTTVTLPTGTSFLSTTTSPLARQTAVRTDSLGRVRMARTVGLDSTWYQYDTRGRLQRVQRGGRAVLYGYEATLGRLAAVTDPLGRVDSLGYSTADRLTRYRHSDARVISFAYDSSGNLTSVTPPGKPAHSFTYSPIDLRATYTPPSLGSGTWSTTYTYNRDRQLTQIERPTGDAIGLSYDGGGRPSTVGFNRGSLGNGTLTMGYSPTSGSLTSLAAPGSETLTFAYDGALPKTVTWGGTVAGSVGLRYDGAFRVDTILVNGATPIGFVYDADGLLTKAGALAIGRASTGLWRRDTVGAVVRGYGYSAHGELAADTTVVNGTTVYQVGYTRDSLGRITTQTETIQGTSSTWGYTYDGANRLWQVRVGSTLVREYGYDLNGNRVTLTGPGLNISGSVDAQDRLTSYGPSGSATTYVYDRAGQLQTATTGGQTTTYTYDALGNLLQVQRPGGLPLIQYVIDGQNRRIGRKVGGTLTTGWLYQRQLAPIAELDGAGAVVSRFIYASRPNVPDLMLRGGVTYRLVTDHLGSVRLVVNTSTNTVVQRTDYDEFGQITAETVASGFVPVPFGFAGGLLDRETALIRFGARDYDPRTGRWTAKDPLGLAGSSANFYTYVGNDPISYVDPLGLTNFSSCETEKILKIIRDNATSRAPDWWKKHSGSGDFDFKAIDQADNGVLDDYYNVEGQVIRSDVFGNYAAGYAGTYAYDLLGWAAAHVGGIVYDFNDSRNGQGSFDFDLDSWPGIDAGAGRAVRELPDGPLGGRKPSASEAGCDC